MIQLPFLSKAKFQIQILIWMLLVLCGAALSIPAPAYAANAEVLLSPSTGTHVVGSTFDVSIFLDTQGYSVNTIDLDLRYPQDKLQLVSSSTGKSIIGIWTSVPKYDNATGTISLVGGVPGGVSVNQGLITTFTFRVRAVGTAIVKFESSRVLLNDGLGTEILSQPFNSVYNLVLPPPGGPIVSSSSHPDQTQWYDNANAELAWELEGGAEGYSYVLNNSPIDTPDDISEGGRQNVSYSNLPDGRHYFHIKSLRGGVWGGVTHYALNVDTSPPADFKIEVIPGPRTTRVQPVIQFATTDAFSGFGHFELKLVPLSRPPSGSDSDLFIEAESPFVPTKLEIGEYDIIVRAFDNAGNVREVVQRLSINTALFNFIANEGIEFRSSFILSWYWVWLGLLLLAALMGYIAFRARKWHQHVHQQHTEGHVPESVQEQISELRKYREKYGKLAVLAFLALSTLLGSVQPARAQSADVLAPPVVSTISSQMSNEEIFYAGGTTGVPSSEVILYLQNLQTTETNSHVVEADKNGEWFYRADRFFAPGTYVIWGQTRVNQQLSPPSPQIGVTVVSTAVQFGSTRFSYSAIYLTLLIIALLVMSLLAAYTAYHIIHGRRKHKMLLAQVSAAGESIRRGFAVLNRDLQAELEIIRNAKLSKELSAEEKFREQQLLSDLSEIEQRLSREIWNIEDTEIRT
jgi:hypothetical protein